MKRIAFAAALVAALTLAPPAAAANDWTWPVRGDVVTPYRNGDDPYAAGQHRGIDIAAPVGARVDAAVAGRVSYVGSVGSSGLTVGVRSSDDSYDVSYLHLSAAAVREGDRVDGGQAIGSVGTSGRRTVDQPHLHLGVRDAGRRHAYRDPLDLLPPLAPPVARPEPQPVVAAAPEPAPASPAAAPALAAPAVPVAEVGGALVPRATGPVAAGSAAQGTAASTPGTRPGGARRAAAHSPLGRRVSGADVAAQRSPERGVSRRGSIPVPNTVRSRDKRTTRIASAGAGPAGVSGEAATPAISTPDRQAAKPGGRGVDAGWLAALIGVVATALCLGRPEGTARAVRRSRATAGALLRPLGGRS